MSGVTQLNVQSLPEFENPPVTEVVCGALFSALRIPAPYFGLFWQGLRSDFPLCQEVAPLMAIVERLGEPQQTTAEITDIPPLPRFWFVQQNGNALIQVQRDRFLYNWRKLRPEDSYPRYESVFAEFTKYLSAFQGFITSVGYPSLLLRQFELTYVNHIPRGQGWEKLSELGEVFPDFTWQKTDQRFLPIPEAVNFRTSFPLREKLGRLHVTLQDASRRADSLPILYLDLTARGISSETSSEAMHSWFSVAHETIVRGFADLTSKTVQMQYWRRTQ